MSLTDDMHDPSIVARVVAYLYQDNYDDAIVLSPADKIQTKMLAEELDDVDGESEGEDPPNQEIIARIIVNASVYSLAEFLDLQDLKKLAQRKFRGAVYYWGP